MFDDARVLDLDPKGLFPFDAWKGCGNDGGGVGKRIPKGPGDVRRAGIPLETGVVLEKGVVRDEVSEARRMFCASLTVQEIKLLGNFRARLAPRKRRGGTGTREAPLTILCNPGLPQTEPFDVCRRRYVLPSTFLPDIHAFHGSFVHERLPLAASVGY